MRVAATEPREHLPRPFLVTVGAGDGILAQRLRETALDAPLAAQACEGLLDDVPQPQERHVAAFRAAGQPAQGSAPAVEDPAPPRHAAWLDPTLVLLHEVPTEAVADDGGVDLLEAMHLGSLSA